MLTRYDHRRSYQWNYQQRPQPVAVEVPAVQGEWSIGGVTLASPLGIAAGPLLHGDWILYYASLGFDWLTYKTVRQQARACYELPNLVPVDVEQMAGDEPQVTACDQLTDTWAVSFGMPSQSPDVWRSDVARTRKHLAAHQRLAVSVVATPQPDWSMEEVANDYATCAAWAADAGADFVEINLSCPNVLSCDGQLYRDPQAAGQVAERVKQAIGSVPLLAKIGYVAEDDLVAELVRRTSASTAALIMVNSLATKVVDASGRLWFEGHHRGICGRAIHRACLDQVRRFQQEVEHQNSALQIVGVGGIRTADDVQAHLAAGAAAVQLATAPMLDPEVGIQIRRGLSAGPSPLRGEVG